MNITRHSHRAIPILSAAIAAASVGSIAQATSIATAGDIVASTASATPTAAVEQRVRAELRALMLELVESGAFAGTNPSEVRFEIDAPSQRVSNLGVLVDPAGADRVGLRVVGVTPGGSGERMGLRSGDLIVSANGESLAQVDDAATRLRAAVDRLPDDGTLALDVRRDGARQSFSGSLAAVTLPPVHLSIGARGAVALASNDRATAASDGAPGCGRISDFDVAPRGERLHAAKIISIDGKSAGPTGTHSFRVEVGRHRVKVAEQIDHRYLPFNDVARNSGTADSRYKTVEVDVAADTTVLIAARLNEATRTHASTGEYWDPVAWSQSHEGCR